MSKIKVFTEQEAAEQMGCSASTLWRRRKENKIRHYIKNGRLIRYTQEHINQNLAEMAANQPMPVALRSVSEARFG